MVKLRCVVVIDYVGDPEHYGTNDPKFMAEIDQTNLRHDPNLVVDMMFDPQYRVAIGVLPLEG